MGSALSYTDLLGNSFFSQSDTEDLALTVTNPYHVVLASKYGAKGDGTTDDTVALQAAITAAAAYTAANPTSYVVVLFPPMGKYITAQLNVAGDRIVLDLQGTLQFSPGDTTSDVMIDVTGNNFEIKGSGVLDCNGAGDAAVGHCLRLNGNFNLVERIKVKGALDTGIVVQIGSTHTEVKDVIVDGCSRSVRVRGDHCYLRRCKFLNFTSQKAVTVDPAVCDTQSFEMKECYFKTDANTWEACILIDPGDGSYAGGGNIACGAPANVGGKPVYTIASGHGYKPGDGFWIGDSEQNHGTSTTSLAIGTGTKVFTTQSSLTFLAGEVVRAQSAANANNYMTGTVTSYSGTTLTLNISVTSGSGTLADWGIKRLGWNIVHKIIAATGDVYARVLSTTTLSLHPSPADAIANTNKVNITSAGTAGKDFYLSTPRGGRHAVANNTGVNASTDVLTTSDTHGFQTGEFVRITPHDDSDSLPGGIQAAGTVTLNSDYAIASDMTVLSSTTTYRRPKRIERAVLEDNVFDAPSVSLNDGSMVKCNNVNYLSIKKDKYNHAHDQAADISSIRLGATVRSAHLEDMALPGGLFFVTNTQVNRLFASHVSFGDETNLPEYGIHQFACSRTILRQCEFHSTRAGIEYDYRDEDLETLEFDDCSLNGYHASTSWSVLRVSGGHLQWGTQMVQGGKVFYRPNNKRRNRWWNAAGGSTVTFADSTDVCTITAHGLRTGDSIYFYANGFTLPTNIVEGTVYYVRVTGNNTFTLHTTRAAATLSTSTPFNLGSDGSGSPLKAKSPIDKLGTSLSDSGLRSILFRCQSSPLDLEDVVSTNATSSVIYLPLGTRIWNQNVAASTSPGWIISQENSGSGATVKTMAAVGA